MAADRIETLIARMTVEEKVGQLGVFADMVRPFAPDVNPEANVLNADQVLQQVRLVGSARCSMALAPHWACRSRKSPWKKAAWASR